MLNKFALGSFVIEALNAICAFGVIYWLLLPYQCTLIRYQTNYTPKAVVGPLDLKTKAPSSERATSYFEMMDRVDYIEGSSGLYKGLMPCIIFGAIFTLVIVPVRTFLAPGYRAGFPHGYIQLLAHPGIADWLLSFALSTVPALLLVPVEIIIYRAITTPHKLATFDAGAALGVLLSPSERAQPLRLYLAPGVALASVLEALIRYTLSLLHYLFVPRLPPAATLGGGLPVVMLAAALMTPLEVMGGRLKLQRRRPEPPGDTKVERLAVMNFRTEKEPYTGLFDCGRKMVQEEGWGALTRGWCLNVLLLLAMHLTI
ncbi:hypothetical protein FB451DRAFT_1403800 [Mycena latifolia]|nr:hypothetical protein FB451DRAFT_1403800 [Mycena latifolia]